MKACAACWAPLPESPVEPEGGTGGQEWAEIHVDNVYAYGTVVTHLRVPITVLPVGADLDEWAFEQFFRHTGTGNHAAGDAMYSARVTGSSLGWLVGKEFDL